MPRWDRETLSERVRRLETAQTPVVQLGSGAPTHEAGETTFYWDSANQRLYINADGATDWRQVYP